MTLTTDRRRRTQQVFDEALARAPEDRAAFVAQACGDDGEVRAEVESLLTHDGQATEDFMWVPETRPKLPLRSDSERPDSRIGTSVGGYRIESVVASGGMGTVYEAVQTEPHRIVALKVLHRHVASQSALRRFRFESQILAHLRHPNIAQVFVAGMHDEGSVQVPYFAMEYVPEARTIIDYVAENKLGTRQRLELFTQVCEAVHHGHQKGIIHRDLKPGNILVDSSGQVKIIDFGVARSTDSDIAMTTMQTDVGKMIGTLQYMSPEQCDADPHEIDTRSDVYSLGVVLYELLTGRLPYDVSHMTIHSGARLICEESPARPSEFDRRLRGDVETIVLKALEKDRGNRYQSASELAGDIWRSLNGEPIDARLPTAWTRGVRWVRRRPIAATATATLCVSSVILVATCTAVWFLNARPYEVVRYRTGERVIAADWGAVDEVRLLSFSGRPLHRWVGDGQVIAFAELAERPVESGGGKLAVIGYRSSDAAPLRGSLCAYDTDGDLDVPIWSHRIETADILPELRLKRGFVSVQFRVHSGKLADVFPGPDHAGDEVVVVFGHKVYSQRVIRIYDLAGELLYQVWHDGAVLPPYWMSGAGLLAFGGDNAMLNWDRYGNPLRPEHNPLVIFALRPEPGSINDTNFINDPNFLRLGLGNDPRSPVWYKCLRLGEVAATQDDISGPRLIAPMSEDPGLCVQLQYSVRGRLDASVGWTIDESGNEASDSRIVNDAYQHNQLLPDGDPKKLPDPRAFHLGPMPPIDSTSQPAEASLGGRDDGP